jgi:lipoyl-dependent peroxiredoxin
MKRLGSAIWYGRLKDGHGIIATQSNVLSGVQYSFATRFENGAGTNPEELIGAAHAGCFSMALAGELGAVGIKAETISTTATVTVEKVSEGFAITAVHLDVKAKIPGADQAAFNTAALKAKNGCPVSKALNVPITMDARLDA